MLRHAGRNQRSKGGFKMRNAVQICLLVVISLWLLYQMQHSQYKKSFEETASGDRAHSDESEVESTRFGRKVLPGIAESNPVRESQTREKYKESLITARQVIKHENEDEKGGISDQKMDAKDQGRTEESITDAENKIRNGVASVVLGDQEHDDASREAREKSFRGDDVSSEVFHKSQVPEHEEASHEAQERRFNGDDASSALEHITTLKESESKEDISFKGDDRSNIIEHFTEAQESESAEGNLRSDGGSTVLEHFTEEKESESERGVKNLDDKLLEKIAMINREAEDTSMVDSTGDSSVVELLDTFDGSNSSPGKGEDVGPSSSPTTVLTALGAKEKEHGPTDMLEEISPSSAMNNDTHIAKKHYPEVKATETKQQIFSTNSVGNQMENVTDSTVELKDQSNFKINSSSLSQDHAEVILKNLTSNITYPRDQLATSHAPQAQNETIGIKVPGEDFSLVSEVSDVPQKSDISANTEEMAMHSKAPSATNDDGKAVPLEANSSLHTGDQKETQGDKYPSNSQNIQNKVTVPNLEASG